MGPKVAADLQHPSASAVFTVATSGCNYVQAGGVSLPMKPGQQPFGTQPQSKFPDLPASCHQSHAECNLWEMVKCSSSLKEIHLHYCWPCIPFPPGRFPSSLGMVLFRNIWRLPFQRHIWAQENSLQGSQTIRLSQCSWKEPEVHQPEPPPGSAEDKHPPWPTFWGGSFLIRS